MCDLLGRELAEKLTLYSFALDGAQLPVDNTNELAVRTLTAIKSKLNGYIGTLSSNSHGPAQGLSVEAQVRELIHLATDPHNLGRMYIGWAAHV